MSEVRVLVGTRKGAFVLTADGKRNSWNVSGPFFGGWELNHPKGSPADPVRLYEPQSSGWFGRMAQFVERWAPILRRVGVLSPQGLACRSGSSIRIAILRMVRADDPAIQ